MKITEQLCAKCGGIIRVGDIVCQNCNADVVLYDKSKTYRFMKSESADYHKEVMAFSKKYNAAFVGLANIGYWIVGPVARL